MNLHLGLTPLISLLAGILILVMPKLLNYIVAIYLIVIGLIGLFGGGTVRLNQGPCRGTGSPRRRTEAA